MPSIRLTGDIAHIMEGTRAQAADLNLTLAEDGFPVAVTIRKGPLEVLTEAESGAIFCGSRAEFFRGLTMLAARFDERPFRVRETPSLDLLGAMLDCSRNAVPTMAAAKTFLRRLSRMGYNAVLLYTEDTYEVAGRPYFGYLRGRFSQAELRELDQYADALGIEMIPCIQTLGHMARALRWPCMEDVRDTDDVLLLDEEKTYALIEEMIVAASRPFATRRIHIGMDEAYGLGRGKYMDRHGYVPQSELMQKHLARISNILKKHGLHAMMWSDMYFHMAQPGSTAAYPAGCTLSEAIVAAAPKDIDLVYWDYYTEDGALARHLFAEHARFSADTLFAGGVYTWNGPVPDYDKAEATTRVLMTACREAGVRQAFATMWGDDGAECSPLLGGLLGLQLFAEIAYNGGRDDDALDARFEACTGCPAQPFRALGAFNRIGLDARPGDVMNPVKQLLYEDPLMPLFEADFAGLEPEAHYRVLAARYARYAEENPAFADFFGFYAQIGRAMAAKCAYRAAAAPAVRRGDRRAAEKDVLPLCDACIEEMRALARCWRALWMNSLRPFGFEVIDIRLSAQIGRLETARERIGAFAQGRLDDIPELTEEKLPYLKRADGTLANLNIWSACVSPTNVSWSF